MSSLLTLLFAPSFLFFVNHYKFQNIVLIYILIALAFLSYAYIKKKKREDFIVVGIYLILLTVAYFNNNLETVKFIPVFSAMAFFSIFFFSAIKKKHLIYNFTARHYKRKISEAELEFLKKGDFYWAIVIFIYAMFLLSLVYYGDDKIWAFFSSVGWYIYFAIALGLHVMYGKLYAIKMSTK